MALAMACLSVACTEREPPAATAVTTPAPTNTAATTAVSTAADTLAGARAIDLVGRYITEQNVYPDVSRTCLNVAAREQQARGWVLEAYDGCSLTELKTHRSLGRWYIDSVTLEIRRL